MSLEYKSSLLLDILEMKRVYQGDSVCAYGCMYICVSLCVHV